MPQNVNGWRSSLGLISALTLLSGTAQGLEAEGNAATIADPAAVAFTQYPVLSQIKDMTGIAFTTHLPERIVGADFLAGDLDQPLTAYGRMIDGEARVMGLLRSTVLVRSSDRSGIERLLASTGLSTERITISPIDAMPWWTVVDFATVRDTLAGYEAMLATDAYADAAIDRIGARSSMTRAEAVERVLGRGASKDARGQWTPASAGALSDRPLGSVGITDPEVLGSTTPNDPRFTNQWYLDNLIQNDQDINVLDAWATATGQGVVIGILDSGPFGFDTNYTDILQEDVGQLHDDLANNYRADISQPLFPFPYVLPAAFGVGDFPRHALGLAGIAAAEGNNSLGITGVAYNAGLAGLRNGGLQQTGEAILWEQQEIDILVHLWGLNEFGQITGGSFILRDFLRDSLETSIAVGRGNLGNIHVVAAGNAGVFRPVGENDVTISDADSFEDLGDLFAFYDTVEGRTDLDLFRSSRFVIAVGAAQEDQGQDSMILPEYASVGSSILVSAPAAFDPASATVGASRAIDTLDLDALTLDSIYTDSAFGDGASDALSPAAFGGTSVPAAITAGVVALMLEANPSLSWRDVQHILVQTADPFAVGFQGIETYDPRNLHPFNDGQAAFRANRSTWQINGGGFPVSDGFGFGLVDAQAAVELAANWTNVPDEFVLFSEAFIVDEGEVGNPGNITIDPPAMGDGDDEIDPPPFLAGVVAGVPYFSPEICVRQNIYVESVELEITLESDYQGDLQIELVSPAGTRSILKKGLDAGGTLGNQLLNYQVPLGFPAGADTGGELRFTTKKHWGERPGGPWQIIVRDLLGEQCCGILVNDDSPFGDGDGEEPDEVDIDCPTFGWCDGTHAVLSWRLRIYGYERNEPVFPCPVTFGTTSCPADINGDGIVDVRDILEFLTLWNQGFAFADINEDGRVDRDDFLAFYQFWITSLGFCEGLTDSDGIPSGVNGGTIGPPVIDG